MKSKRLILCLAFVFALMLALAISSYAATITIHSGADSTSPSTEYNGSITLAGNTEADETVTVYFADDGRAWKAGETVSFKENTVLYTIECTKISTVSEFNNATGGGNYILMSDIDNTQSGRGPINGDNCTTRIFMNGKHFNMGNSDGTMIQGNSQSLYLLGEGYISSKWGGPLYRGHCNNSTADVTWLVGKDVTIETNKDGSSVFTVWNTISAKSLSVHIYGTIIKAQSGTVGTWNLLYADNISTDYDLYLHEGSSVEITGCLVNQSPSTVPAGEKIGEIICEGGSLTLVSSDYFFKDKSSSAYNGTVTVKAGVFTATNASSLAEFKASIESGKRAQDIDATSFKVVCNECDYIKTLGDDFVNLATDFTINNYCPNCKSVGASTSVEKVFTTKGYSVSLSGTAIDGGYGVNQNSLALYESVVGEVKYGIVIANANMFGGKSFFDENNKVNTERAVQIEIDGQYSIFSCSIDFGTTSNSSLNLVICAYAVDSTGASFIQHSTGDAVASSKIAGGAFKSITLDMIATEPATLSTGKND